jgi:hypothetical protein
MTEKFKVIRSGVSSKNILIQRSSHFLKKMKIELRKLMQAQIKKSI